ncbi:MAG TPA: VOC family protein [Verrucomicrobiae bacterium]|nr:VOC family protein [Verrucomicrobiae bacterium]
MLQVTEVAFSCYAVSDLPKARAFYEGVLGLKPNATTSPQWVEYEIGPHALSIGCAPGFNPSPDGCTVALEVANFDEAIAHLRAKNVKFRMEPFTSPVCRMAMVSDPDGNTVCIHKRNAG